MDQAQWIYQFLTLYQHNMALKDTTFYTDAYLVAYYQMEGNSNDSSTQGNNGVDTSMAYSTASGKYGQGANFGSYTSKITVNDSNSISFTGPFTLVSWVFFLMNNNNQSLLEKYGTSGAGGTTPDGFFWRGINGGKIIGGVVSTSTGVYGTSNTALGTGVWTHVGMTYDGTNLNYYYNGNSDGSKACSTNPVNGTNNLRIGAIGDAGNANYYGYMDDTAMFSRALSPTEINQLYNNLPVPTPNNRRQHLPLLGVG